MKIRAVAGSITVESPALFVPGDDQVLHSLIERLLRSSAVRAVAIDRRHSTIEIAYDRSAIDSRAALRELSVFLGNFEPAADGSLVRQYLDRIPGRVKRIERRIPDQAKPSLSTDARLVVENLIVEYDPDVGLETKRGPAGAQGTSVCQQLSVAGALPSDVTQPWVGEVVIGGVRRIVNLTAAGGCLVMSIVGVVTPGIPTVPFVLATGYFLARSSPRLHQRFRRSRFFGQMVSDYEDFGGLRWSTKLKTILFTLGLMVVTVVIAGVSLPLLIVVGTMGTLGIYLVGRIPTVPGDSQPAAAAPATA